ncbi:MAG: F0F1 ATP synthase subunit delta [Spirochaetia bacterium]
MRRLVRLALDPNGGVREDVAAQIVRGLSRSQLKQFLSSLRRELARRRVSVGMAGEAGAEVDAAMARRYPGRAVGINRDESLGAGMRLRAGDDIVDASVRGYIRDIIEKLEAP